jgi:hypothetical protein
MCHLTSALAVHLHSKTYGAPAVPLLACREMCWERVRLWETQASHDLQLGPCLVAPEKQGEQGENTTAFPNPHFLSRQHARAPGA